MEAAGLSLGSRRLNFIKLVPKHGSFRVSVFEALPLSPGTIESGVVVNREPLLKALRELKNRYHLQFVRVSIPEEEAFLFKTLIPNVSEADMRGAIELRLEENVPIAAREAIFDYNVIGPAKLFPDQLEVGVSVLPIATVMSFLEVFNAAGLVPKSLEIEAQAIARAIVSQDGRGTFLTVNFGDEQTGLSIVDAGTVVFTSTVAIGGDAITTAIEKAFSISRTEAEKIKTEQGLSRSGGNREVFSSIVNTLSALKDEISKVLTYWHTHKGTNGELGRKITKIILCGHEAALEGLDTYLTLDTKARVEVANPWQNTLSLSSYVPPIPRKEALDYVAAIGLALPRKDRYV